MSYSCYKCGTELVLATPGKPSRKESCSKCLSDLHSCRNCRFYDPGSYNDCRESSADRVVDKEKGNFCDFFSFKEGNSIAGATLSNPKKEAFSKLDDLFKK